MTAQDVYALFETLGIAYRKIEHEPAWTMAQCKTITEVEDAVPLHCKNLLLANRQGTTFVLLLVAGDKPLKTADVSKQLGLPRLSFATPAQLWDTLGLMPGAVNPLALAADKAHRVALAVDQDLLAQRMQCFHPCDNTASVVIGTEDLLRFVAHTGHEYTAVRM